MTFARIRLFVAALAFFSWLAWLAFAVAKKGTVQILSRAQLTEATHLVVATVSTNESGDADSLVTIQKVLRLPAGEKLPDTLDIPRLDKAVTPLPIDGSRKIGAGVFLIPLLKLENGFRIAGLPRSPGFEGTTLERPIVYPWTDDVKKQLKALGLPSE
jgi:hypothetical protein